jgi:hypothetical protein
VLPAGKPNALPAKASVRPKPARPAAPKPHAKPPAPPPTAEPTPEGLQTPTPGGAFAP